MEVVNLLTFNYLGQKKNTSVSAVSVLCVNNDGDNSMKLRGESSR